MRESISHNDGRKRKMTTKIATENKGVSKLGTTPITPPSSAEISRVTGAFLTGRNVLRISDLSVVERVTLTERPGAPPRAAILKTTLPLLRHELLVHRLASPFPICAAQVIASSDANVSESHPWLLIEEVGDGVDDRDFTTQQIMQALVEIARLHRYYVLENSALDDDTIPRCDRVWLESLAESMPEFFRHFNQKYGLNISQDVQRRFQGCLIGLSDRLADYAFTLVHGDFDKGNLVLFSDGWVAALDWGLAHVNLPLVDLAHIVASFDIATKFSVSSTYLDALDLPEQFPAHSEKTVLQFVELGDILHKIFFIWWHSTIVTNGWVKPDKYLDTIRERILFIAFNLPKSK